MDAQGYPVKNNIILQDNKSAILLETNGTKSCSKRSRHFNIRHFFIKDLVDKHDAEIKYCATENMLADFFSKPLQGNLFKKFRSVVLGHQPLYILRTHKSSYKLKERVGRCDSRENNEM